jgi:DNA-binding NarL/FixJ family response regulator
LQNKDIAAELILSEATIKTHRRNLKGKLKAKSTLDLRDIAERGGLLE